MSEKQDLTELARCYVESSNLHDLGAIGAMFEADAIYRSSSVGFFEGRTAILEMMAGFFTKFPDVCWEVAEYSDDGNQTVGFAFTMTATDASSGDALLRKGLESLKFSPRSLISEIDVRTVIPAPD